MGKAASHKVGIVWVMAICVAVIVLFASVTRAAAYTVDPNEVPVGDQDINDGAIGFITISGDRANATVENISDATISGGLASYTKAEGDTENQVLFDSVSYTLEPHSKVDLSVRLPCWAQVDLFKGGLISSFANGARYGTNLIAAMHTQNECAPSNSPSATPVATPGETPTVTASPTPSTDVTPSPTPVVTASPTPVATETPSNGGSTNNSSSNTSSTGSVLSAESIPRGGVLPSTGGADYGFLVFAGYVLAGGIGLRKYASYIEMK